MINARDLFVEISNQPVLENGESVGYFVKNSRMDALEELLSANSPQPAPVVPEECPDELLAFCEQVIDSRITANAKADELWSACRTAMLLGNHRDLSQPIGQQVAEYEKIMLQGGQPVSQTYNLPELIEGMEVSVDVSTCDFDAGHRYFGTVTEISELYTAKNGYILLVQDAKPNFDVNGNSPVIPDGWISCSERMPDREYVLAGDFSGTHYLASIPNVQVGIYADWFDDEKPCWDDGDGNDLHLKEVTHWMPLPEPPQEVNRG